MKILTINNYLPTPHPQPLPPHPLSPYHHPHPYPHTLYPSALTPNFTPHPYPLPPFTPTPKPPYPSPSPSTPHSTPPPQPLKSKRSYILPFFLQNDLFHEEEDVISISSDEAEEEMQPGENTLQENMEKSKSQVSLVNPIIKVVL